MQTVVENKVVPKLRFFGFQNEWDFTKLKDVASVKRGAGSQYIKYSKKGNGSIRLIRIGDFLGGEEVYVENNEAINRFILERNDILIAGTGATAGITFLVPDEFVDFAYSYNAPKIKVKDCNVNFIYYHLISDKVVVQQKRLFTGNAQPFLDTNAIKNFKLYLPSLTEQKKIAAFLSSVDEKLQQLNKKKSLLEDYKKGVMQKIFSQELPFKDDNGNNYHQWEESKLKELVSTPISDGPHSTPKFIKDGIPFLSVNNIVDCKIDFTNARTISNENHLEFSKKCKPIKNDLLLGKAASVGKIAIVETDIEFNIWSPLAMIRIKETYVSKYFYYCFQTQTLQKRIKRFINSSSQGNIGMGDIGKLIFEYPKSKEEQQKIANFLSAIDDKIDVVSIQIENTQAFKKGLLQQMFV